MSFTLFFALYSLWIAIIVGSMGMLFKAMQSRRPRKMPVPVEARIDRRRT